MKKSIYPLVATLLTFTMLLSACGTPATSPTTTTTTPPQTTTTAPPATTARPTPTMTQAAGTPQYGGVLRIATSTHPSTLLPTKQPLKQAFLGALFDTLIRLDEKGELQP